MKLKILFVFLITILLYSCQSIPKDISYFQSLNPDRQVQINESLKSYEATIKVNDALHITVSATNNSNPELTVPFNLPLTSYLTPGEKSVTTSAAVQTYLVDKNGFINFPVIGKVELAGLSLSQASDAIAQKVSLTVPDPIINVDILSFQVSVLGEVNKPGRFPVPTSRISILDAIAAAEDMTIYGNRKNVLLIRENNGKQEYIRFDLTQLDVFSSPYFYLQQNDVLIVDANDAKKKESKHGNADSFKLASIATILSSVTAISSILIAISTINNK